jgi:hypothetical protein
LLSYPNQAERRFRPARRFRALAACPLLRLSFWERQAATAAKEEAQTRQPLEAARPKPKTGPDPAKPLSFRTLLAELGVAIRFQKVNEGTRTSVTLNTYPSSPDHHKS